jgi:hypothetical protein
MMSASELRLRGKFPVVQPHRDVEGNVLCWNGEVRAEKSTSFSSYLTLGVQWVSSMFLIKR